MQGKDVDPRLSCQSQMVTFEQKDSCRQRCIEWRYYKYPGRKQFFQLPWWCHALWLIIPEWGNKLLLLWWHSWRHFLTHRTPWCHEHLTRWIVDPNVGPCCFFGEQIVLWRFHQITWIHQNINRGIQKWPHFPNKNIDIYGGKKCQCNLSLKVLSVLLRDAVWLRVFWDLNTYW